MTKQETDAPDAPLTDSWRRSSALVLGAIGGVSTLIAAIALPNLIEARKNANETAAIGALKTIGVAQSHFREADEEHDGNLDYGTLAELGAAGLIDEVLATGFKDGYVFEATYGPLTSEFIWMATARPLHPGSDGDRYFATNHEGVTFYTTSEHFRFRADCEIDPFTRRHHGG